MRFLPIVLLLGIIFNTVTVLYFRISLDRRNRNELKEIADSFRSQLISFSADALQRIDNYVISNRVNSSSSSVSSSRQNPFSDSGDCDYYYYAVSGVPCARIGISDFHVGSFFPRGGLITAIYPDCIIVNDEFMYRNRQFVPFVPSVDSPYDNNPLHFNSYNPIRITNNVSRSYTMR